MAIHPKTRQWFTDRKEAIAEKQLRKLGVRVQRLDHQGPRKRPEFVLRDRTSGAPVMLAEVKTVLSAGYDQTDGVHLSTMDPDAAGKVRAMPAVSERYRDALEDAAKKYRTVVADEPEFRRLPYVVVFFSDFFAPADLLDRRQPEFPEVSGYMLLVENREFLQAAEAMPLEELRRRCETGSTKGMPPPGKEWRLLENPHAGSAIPAHIRAACLVGYAEDDDIPEDWDGEGAVPGKVSRRPTGPKA